MDFSRANAHTAEFVNFLDNVNVKPCISLIANTINFTRKQGHVLSCIDHFAISGAFSSANTCIKYALIEDTDIS